MKVTRQLVGALLLAALSGGAQAYGLKYAVDSLPKAQALAKQDTARHVLVFYTSPT
jgi:hypothetical protein